MKEKVATFLIGEKNDLDENVTRLRKDAKLNNCGFLRNSMDVIWLYGLSY